MSTFYELAAVVATALALSSAILGWTSVKELNRKIVCSWGGRFGRVKMVYLGVSAALLGSIMLEHLGSLYRFLGSNRGESIALAYGIIIGVMIFAVLVQAAILRFSARWHRLKIVERLYYEIVKAERIRKKQARAAQASRIQQPRRGPAHHPGPRRHDGMYDCVTNSVIVPGEKVAEPHLRPASAEDMEASVEAIGTLVVDALRRAPLDERKIEIVLLARSANGTTKTIAELGNLSDLVDPDQEYEESSDWSYKDCPEVLAGRVASTGYASPRHQSLGPANTTEPAIDDAAN